MHQRCWLHCGYQNSPCTPFEPCDILDKQGQVFPVLGLSKPFSYVDEEVETGEGEADEDALVDVHRPVEDVAPQQRQGEGQGADKI